jgi:hypothetical protein
MRTMENAARYGLTNLMLGRPFLFDTINQRLVATFLCLASMRLERGSKGSRAIPDSDIEYLKTKFEPPKDWHIWVTRFIGVPHSYFSAQTGMQRGPLENPAGIGVEHCNEQVSTFIAGWLCAHLFSSSVRDFFGYVGVEQTKVWPPSGLDVDSRLIPRITYPEVTDLHEAIARDGNPPVRIGRERLDQS